MSLSVLIKEKLMQRKIEQWKNCVPDAMVHMSTAAIRYAFEDAKSDILSLWEANQRLRLLEKENQNLKAEIKELEDWRNNSNYGDGYNQGYSVGLKEGYDEGFEDGKDYMRLD